MFLNPEGLFHKFRIEPVFLGDFLQFFSRLIINRLGVNSFTLGQEIKRTFLIFILILNLINGHNIDALKILLLKLIF